MCRIVVSLLYILHSFDLIHVCEVLISGFEYERYVLTRLCIDFLRIV